MDSTGATVGKTEFLGSAGAYYEMDLVEGINVRDHYWASFNNVIDGINASDTLSFLMVDCGIERPIRMWSYLTTKVTLSIAVWFLSTRARSCFPLIGVKESWMIAVPISSPSSTQRNPSRFTEDSQKTR